MDTAAFIDWALDEARTLEERYTTLLLVELCIQRWTLRHQPAACNWQAQAERKRQRYLNPAYQPVYREKELRRAAEIMPELTEWELKSWQYQQERPIRDMAVVRFLPALRKLTIHCELPDISLLPELPALRELHFFSPVCEDFRPLARCTQLQSLVLTLGVHWPEVEGLEKLQQLESLSLGGNLLVFPRGLVFPNVRQGALSCSLLHARRVGDLPQFPACEFLALSGVERLEGIEEMPRLRNLTLTGPVRDFAPLAALGELTWLRYIGSLPLDVTPLAAIPRLLYAGFVTQHCYGGETAPPRDYSPLAASASLRELSVTGCPPVEMEVAALNAALPPYDDLFLAPEPRPIPPLRMIVAPHKMQPRRDQPHRGPDEPDLIDIGLRECEGRWVARFVERLVTERIGHTDWGEVTANGQYCSFTATIECYEVLERLPEIIDALRAALARLRHDYFASFYICLRVPPPKPTEAQAELLRRFHDEQEEAEFAQKRHEEQERHERLYLYRLKQELGEPIDPEEFAPGPREPLPPPPWEVGDEEEGDDDEDDSEGAGGTAVKKKPDPPPDPWDDEHPLAGNYRLAGTVRLSELWIPSHAMGLAIHLMGREPDEVFPEEKKPA